MLTDAEIQEMQAELAAYRKRDNVLHPKVDPAYYVGQWVVGPDGEKHRVLGRAIDWDKNVTYTLGLPVEKDGPWTTHHVDLAESAVVPILHQYAIGQSVIHAGTAYQIGAQHFDDSGNPYYELRDPESNGGRFAKHVQENDAELKLA